MADFQMLPMDKLQLDPRFQHRVDGLNIQKVAQYAEILDILNEKAPPVVFKDGKKYWLPGGFHRFEAFRKGGRNIMRCEIREGGWLQAYEYSLGENAEHGQPRTNADKRKSVLDALDANQTEKLNWTDREICKHCKVNHGYLNDLRRREKELSDSDNSHYEGAESDVGQYSDETTPQSEIQSDAPEAAPSTDGATPSVNDKVQEMIDAGTLTGNIKDQVLTLDVHKQALWFRRVQNDGMTLPQALDCVLNRGGKRTGASSTGKPNAPPTPRAELRDKLGTLLPDSCRDAFADPSLGNLIEELENVEAMLSPQSWTTRAGKLTDHYGFILIDKFHEHAWQAQRRIQLALEALRAGVPHALCPKCNGIDSKKDGKTCRACRGYGHVPEHRYGELSK